MHCLCIYFKNDGLAVSCTYFGCGCYIHTKVYVLAGLLLESAFENALYKPAGSAVVQTFGGVFVAVILTLQQVNALDWRVFLCYPR